MAFQPNAFQNNAFQVVKVPDWFVALSEPVRFRTYFPARERFPAQLGDYSRSFFSGATDLHFIDWYRAFTDPVRVLEPKPFLHPGRYGGMSLWMPPTPVDPDPHIVPWFQWLTEPQRSKPLLSAPWIEASPFVPRPYVTFSFALTESRDFSNINVNVYWPKQDAKVTITEIETYPTRVTIREIKYTRGYS